MVFVSDNTRLQLDHAVLFQPALDTHRNGEVMFSMTQWQSGKNRIVRTRELCFNNIFNVECLIFI